MLSQEIQNNLEKIRKSVLVLDIETSSFLPDGSEISIKTNFDGYVSFARVKWFGCYSYKYNTGYYLNAQTEASTILKLLNEHDVLVGFNIEDFDYPILVNNGFTNPEKRYIQVDCMQILGTVNQRNKQGYTFKNRAALMDYKLKNNHLRGMAEAMQLEHQKGDIDWHIFQKDEWTDEEILEIKKYLYSDVMATKGLYEKLWYYWLPFAELLPEKNVYDLSWIRSSIASLTYKAACNVLNVEPTYSEKPGTEEAMGGNVYEPKYEELNGVWYVDFGSLYPHLMVMANISAEVDMERVPSDAKLWHGNEIFQVKGYYDVSKFHPLSDYIAAKLKQRIALKELDKTDPMVYTLKILLNCFSSDTAVVMADNSVKNIKDCKIGEYLWSINPNTLYAEKKKIIKTFEYDYNGDIHYYQGNYFNFKVTPNHRFLLHKVNNDTGIISEPKFYESQEITTNYKLPIHKNKKQNNKKNINILDYFPNDYFLYSIKSKSRHGRTWLTLYNLNGKYLDYNCNNTNFIFDHISIKDVYNKLLQDNDLDIYLFKNGRRREHKKPILYNNDAFSYLIGIYLSEGSATYTKSKKYENGNCRGENYSIQLAQYKNINPIIYKKIQDSLDKCGLKYSAGKTGFKVTGSIFYDFILNNFGKLNYKHFINKKLFDELNLRKVWEGLIDGDGSKKSNLYTTKYDCLKNDFIELCIRLGYTFVIKNDGCWRIVYNKSQNVFRPTLRTIEKYNDKVYCVEVEENNTLLAGRNNYFNWSGNSFYGVMRSPIFEKVHTPNAGWDICWLGQQVQQLLKEMIEQFGFEVVMGDTDSVFFVAKEGTLNTREYVQDCLNQITDIIKDSFPFPVDTFKINIEHYLEHLMIPFEEQSVVGEDGKNKKENGKLIKERKGKKKNYLYIYKDNGESKIKLVGLPIIKDNATQLGPKIYEEVLKPEILKNNRAKFPASFIEQTINDYLKKPEIMQLLSQEYKVNTSSSYKLQGQIQAQISQGYFNGGEGVIRLIKNTKVGKAGKGMLYCTVQEATDAKLTAEELDLDKVRQELSPFIEYVELSKESKSLVEQGLQEAKDGKLVKADELLEQPKKKRGRPRKT